MVGNQSPVGSVLRRIVQVKLPNWLKMSKKMGADKTLLERLSELVRGGHRRGRRWHRLSGGVRHLQPQADGQGNTRLDSHQYTNLFTGQVTRDATISARRHGLFAGPVLVFKATRLA